MKFVIIFGDSAVGKMTVGEKLTKITDLKLFHNHMMIEPVIQIFDGYRSSAINKLRDVIFKEFAKTDNYGLIFTFMWAFDQQEDWDYIENVTNIFKEQGAEIYYIELVASQEIRLQRNGTENRLKHKPSKRNIDESNQRIITDNQRFRLVSYDDEITFENYIKIDNSNISAMGVAEIIKKKFDF